MQKISLEVFPRAGEKEAKANPNRLRREGWIPGVLYGHGKPMPIKIETRHLKTCFHTSGGTSALFNVKLGSDVSLSIVKELQRDTITREFMHLDLMRVNLKEKLDVTVPVHLHGEPVGVKTHGGILENIQRDIRVRCLPDDIPTSFDVDISTLDLHQAVRVQDLKTSAAVEILTPKDHIVAHVVSPRAEEEVAAPAEGAVAGAEPEVIAKGKKEEEGAVAPAGGASAAGKAAPAAGKAAPAADAGKKEKK